MFYLINDTLTAYNSSALDKTNTGLGNVLFQIASVYGIGKLLNRHVYYTNVDLFNKKLSDLFGYDYSTSIFRSCIETAPLESSQFTQIPERSDSHRIYNQDFIQSIHNTSENIKILGHLEVPEYFLQSKDDIINMFSVDDLSLKLISEKYPELFDPKFSCISLHFRLSQFGDDLQMGVQYYIDSIQYLKTIIENPMFFLFTDDINALKTKYTSLFDILIQYPYKIVENNLDYIDLWTISLCKHNIVCKSTFSFWGAFLNKNNDKIVLIPKDSPRFLSFIDNNHPI